MFLENENSFASWLSAGVDTSNVQTLFNEKYLPVGMHMMPYFHQSMCGKRWVRQGGVV